MQNELCAPVGQHIGGSMFTHFYCIDQQMTGPRSAERHGCAVLKPCCTQQMQGSFYNTGQASSVTLRLVGSRTSMQRALHRMPTLAMLAS